jgi:N-acetylglutamate synthase-like GNAT family acetyltransferase
MNDYQLRQATSDDSPSIRKLVLEAHINPTSLDWNRFIVAVDPKDRVIGCGQVKPHRDGSLELASLVVHPSWRGLGMARDILEHLIASHEGTLYLMCRSSLGPLYEKFGFQAIDTPQMPKYFQRVSRISGIIETLRKEGEKLLIMKREA